MTIKTFINNAQLSLGKAEYQIKNFWKDAWPPRLDIWRQPRVLFKSFTLAPYSLKVVSSVSLVIFVLSSLTFVYGWYLMLTTEAASQGGVVQEAVLSSELKTFNPVLEPNSLAETKVNNLLYHPLYLVDYPDFLNDTTTNPVIHPKLIEKEPEWIDLNETQVENRHKTLRFTLKNEIKWSNGKPITLKDITYTFDRLKEPNGNGQFRQAFVGVTIATVPGSDSQFDLISEKPNPQLIYAANFIPISSEYYGSQIADRLLSDPKSFKPTVTSGYFTFPDGPISDPDNPQGEKVENPIRDKSSNNIKTIVLNRNGVQNADTPYISNYIIRRTDVLQSSGGENDNSLERLAKDGKVDIFTRYLGSNLYLSSSEVKQKLNLNQKIIPTNTFYNLYLNIRPKNYFINQTMRKYILCQLINYPLNPAYSSQLEAVPPSKRLVPIQLGAESNPDCSNIDGILDPNNYTIQVDERTKIKRVLLSGEEIAPIELVGFKESDPLLTDIQIFFRDIGIPAEVISDSRLTASLNDKTFNAAFLPITIGSRDLYGLLGAGGRNLSSIRLNNRVDQYKAEENLYNYSLSNLTDQTAKTSLVDFFSKEFVAVNLFRSNFEINYSDRVKELPNYLPGVSTFSIELYKNLPRWFVETRRTWK